MPRVGFQLALFDPGDDVGQDRVGSGCRCRPRRPSRATKPFRNSISVRRPLTMSWAIDGRCSPRAGWRWRQPGVARPRSRPAPPRRPRRRGRVVSGSMWLIFSMLIAQRLADADRLAAEPDREAADGVVRDDSRGRSVPVQADSAVAHARLATSFDQRSPHRLVGRPWRCRRRPTSARHLLDALGDAAVHLADAEHGVRSPPLASVAADVARLVQVDGDRARRPSPPSCPSRRCRRCVSSFRQFCSDTT